MRPVMRLRSLSQSSKPQRLYRNAPSREHSTAALVAIAVHCLLYYARFCAEADVVYIPGAPVVARFVHICICASAPSKRGMYA